MNYITNSTTSTTRNSMKLSAPAAPLNHNSSTWQQLVVGAGSAAGSTAAVVSEESMKCLRYCVSWLQYAIRHLSQQMGLLRNFLVSLATSPSQQQPPMILASIKKDMVSTLRKVIDIITCYAGNALPNQAKATIRGAILNLPSRLASLYNETNNENDDVIQQQTKHDPAYRQEDVALRLLAFGQESNEMLSSIHTVFDDTIQRAESWLERIRMINPMSSSSNNSNSIQLPLPNSDTTSLTTQNDDEDDFYNVLLPPIRNLHISTSSSTSSTITNISSQATAAQ